MPSNNNYQTVDILGIPVKVVTLDQLHEAMGDIIDNGRHSLVMNVNVNCLNLSVENPWLHDFLNTAEIVFCDGSGVMLGAQILGTRLPERITGADWYFELAEYCEPRGYSFYFLGAKPGNAQMAAEKMRRRFPKLDIAGTHHGYFDMTPGSAENTAVIEGINQAKPNILMLGFGMPLQERWLMENWDQIDANIALNGGAVFDYISGELQRSPRWMNDHGMEWLGRFLIEPRRLWHRYLVGNPQFLWRVMKQRVGRT